MAMTPLQPIPVRVRTGWFDVRPREITWGSERFPVISVAAVRDETSAYPVATGPRVLFEVETPSARLALTFRPRGRRWAVEGVDRAAWIPNLPAGARILPAR